MTRAPRDPKADALARTIDSSGRIAGAILLVGGMISGLSLLRDAGTDILSTGRVVLFFVDMILGASLLRGRHAGSSWVVLRAVLGGPLLVAAAHGELLLQVLPLVQSAALLWLTRGPVHRVAMYAVAAIAAVASIVGAVRVWRGPLYAWSTSSSAAVDASGEMAGTILPWRMNVPSGHGWRALDRVESMHVNSGADLWLVRPSIEAGLMVIPELTAGDDVSTEHYADAVLVGAKARFAPFSELSRRPLRASATGPHAPLVVRAHGAIGGDDLDVIYGFFSGELGAFQIYGYAPSSAFSQVERDFTAMIESFVGAAAGGLTSPSPVVAIAEPVAPPDALDGVNLLELSAEALRAAAEDATDQGQPAAAAVMLHHAVRRGAAARADLASALVASGQVEPGMYWLQQAALTEGVDPFTVNADAAFDALRRDPRWPSIALFLGRAARDHQRTIKPRFTVVAPSGASPSTELPAIVALPGLAFSPDDMVGPEIQPIADELGVVFVGVSGVIGIGEDRYRWTETPELDLAWIDRALSEVATKQALDRSRIALMGYGQGAQVAMEAALSTSRFTGAILLSPAGQWPHPTSRITLDAGAVARRFVLVRGAELPPDTEPQSVRDEEYLLGLHVNVLLKAYDGVAVDAPPPDAFEMLPPWARHALGMTP